MQFKAEPGSSAREVVVLFQMPDGRLRRWLERVGLAADGRLRAGRVAVVALALTWVPLLILSVIEGVAWSGGPTPFLRDFLPYGQFLIAAPTLILGKTVVVGRLSWVIAGLRQSDVLAPANNPLLDKVLTDTSDHASRWRINGVLLALTVATTVVSLWSMPDALTGSWQTDGSGLTLPGWWYVLVGLPVMRFLMLQWLWKIVVWGWLLWRVSRMDLQPQPMHPDRAGGLAFFGGAQAAFGIFVFAIGVQLSCLVADAVHYGGEELTAFRGYIVTYVLAMVVWPLLPMLAFTPKLVRARERSLVFLSSCGYEGGEYLTTLLRDSDERAMSHVEVSSLADFGALYENVRLMRPMPVEVRHVVFLIVAAILPFLPLALLVMPVADLLRNAVRLFI